MKLFGPLYRRTMEWSRHEKAPYYLSGLSFAESSFFPIPPDVMLAPMAMANPERWKFLAFLTAITSVLGGLFGYLIGAITIESILPWLQTTNYWPRYEQAVMWFEDYGIWAILIAGFSPVPYKIFTLAAGASGMALVPFILASAVARSARFFLVAGLMAWGGPKMEATLNSYIERLGWASIVLLGFAAWMLKG